MCSRWNCLDFVILISSLAAFLPSSFHMHAAVDVRLLRMLRPLRLIDRVPGVKVIVHGSHRTCATACARTCHSMCSLFSLRRTLLRVLQVIFEFFGQSAVDLGNVMGSVLFFQLLFAVLGMQVRRLHASPHIHPQSSPFEDLR